ncbi:putative replication initiation protein, partial [Eel River basin pequenovirus]
CLGCRLDYSRMWAMRIVHEASMHEYTGGNCFVTLTYRDMSECSLKELENRKHVPDDWSLDKAHIRNFIKRLRKAFPDQNIRYFYAGEYGRKCKHGIDTELVGCPLCNCGRPHFHACLFNCSFTDLEAYQSDGGIMRYTSPTLEKIWGYGFVDVGELNFSSASYTARYIVKKIKGVKQPDHYMSFDLNGEITFISPEFVGMSRGNAAYKGQRCGIGAGWYQKYKDDVFPSDEVPVPGAGVMNGVPRYYDDILRDENPEMFEEVKKLRNTFMREHSEEYTHERLLAKHKCKKARLKLKERIL